MTASTAASDHNSQPLSNLPLSEQSRLASGLSQAELERLAGVARKASEAGAERLRHHFGQLERIR